MTPTEKAREAFNEYAAMDSPDLPENPVQALQVELFRWESREFGGGNITNSVLGTNEEIGEHAESMIMILAGNVATARMARAILKRGQGIRGFDDTEKYKEGMGDAMADNVIFTIQACTKSRLDFWTLLRETASDVMDNRKWSLNKLDGSVGIRTSGPVIVMLKTKNKALRDASPEDEDETQCAYPFSVMIFDTVSEVCEGWGQQGVHATLQEAQTACKKLKAKYGWTLGIADTRTIHSMESPIMTLPPLGDAANGKCSLNKLDGAIGARPGSGKSFIRIVKAEAFRWDGKFTDDIPKCDREGSCHCCGQPMNHHGWNLEGHGKTTICPGHWVVTEDGVTRSVHPERFSERYREKEDETLSKASEKPTALHTLRLHVEVQRKRIGELEAQVDRHIKGMGTVLDTLDGPIEARLSRLEKRLDGTFSGAEGESS